MATTAVMRGPMPGTPGRDGCPDIVLSLNSICHYNGVELWRSINPHGQGDGSASTGAEIASEAAGPHPTRLE